jgi:GT2 family glycosyltransferase
MKKEIFCFVILHYKDKSLIDTFECVESILKLFFKKCNILIIDNGSEDLSEKKLKERYYKENQVEIISASKNLGFARGNNYGCNFAIKKYDPEFLIVINNDTVIKQSSFLSKIAESYEKYGFDMMGPFIYDRNNKPQNPLKNVLTQKKEIESFLNSSKKRLRELQENDNYFYKYILRSYMICLVQKNKWLEKAVRKLLNKEVAVFSYDFYKEYLEVPLHGSALIFSKKYFEKFNDVFLEGTFLYLEEDLLYHRVRKENLISVYNPGIEIYHKEDSSTNALEMSSREKNIFKIKNQIESLKYFLEILE